MSNTLHVALAAQQVHEAAKYYPITDNDKKTALEGLGVAAGVVLLLKLVTGGSRKAAASR